MDADASHYQANKDDEADWEEAPAPRRRSEQRRLDAMVSVRFSPEEAERVRADADAAGLSLSRYIRELALRTTLGYTMPTSITVGSSFAAGKAKPPAVTSTPVRTESRTVAA